MIRGLLGLIPALWIVIVAIVAVQNATPVSVQLLWGRSVPLPFGVVLAMAIAIAWGLTGVVMGMIPPRAGQREPSQRD